MKTKRNDRAKSRATVVLQVAATLALGAAIRETLANMQAQSISPWQHQLAVGLWVVGFVFLLVSIVLRD